MTDHTSRRTIDPDLHEALRKVDKAWCIQHDGELMMEDAYRVYMLWCDEVRPFLHAATEQPLSTPEEA